MNTNCGDAGTECTNQDRCDGGGSCTDNGFVAADIACGHVSDTECNNPDSCNGAGSCLDNHEDSGIHCGDAGTECINQDTCDGDGSCADNGFVATDTACGDGSDTECSDPDSCDGEGICQPNDDASDGIACGDNETECHEQDTCGAGSCTDNGFLASGSSCSSDGNECTDDECDGGGTCSHPNNANSCEDGDPATWDDQCSAGICESGFFACPMFPLDGCRAPVFPGKSSIYLRTAGGAKDVLKWKWRAGAATSLADYGDPVNSDQVSLCLYDEDNDVPTLVVEQVIDPGGSCGGKACWKGSPRMYKYNSKGVVTSHGVGNLKLKRGEDGKASIAAKAKGVGIALPTAPLLADSHITMQLVSEPGGCWETVFDATSVTIKNGKLKAK
ncbi:MAG: hypothetical protein HRT46_06910 [Deltaproteobacteria bacterium]|nr:hypothetical protein [Deltaproteobacteria bacterium]